MQSAPASIIDCLNSNVQTYPGRIVYTILGQREEPERTVTYAQLAAMVNGLALQLSDRQLHNKRVLLLYDEVLDFIVAFLVCQLLDIVAVPVPYIKGKKQIARLLAVMDDAAAETIFCAEPAVNLLQAYLPDAGSQEQRIEVIATSTCAPVAGSLKKIAAPDSISFIQYTSGSTGKPKGVVISCKNLMHNQQLIKDTFHCDENAVIFSWLPYHHDMGLIGNILHTLYVGCTCIVMSPFEFIQHPMKWIECISKYRVTHSGAPNFAYDHCVDKLTTQQLNGLDLSCWKVAYNGSEPVQAATMRRFAAAFSAAGFDQQAFYPCYGMAEATLLVSGIRQQRNPLFIRIIRDKTNGIQLIPEGATHAGEQVLVSSGQAAYGMDIIIAAMEAPAACKELEEGEICICGDSVFSGYWNKEEQDIFVELYGKQYFKTGDLGFLYNNELFVNGRRKEMLIIRGRNFYPADIEATVAASDDAIETHGVAVFEWRQEAGEWVVIAEIKRSALKSLHAAAVIRNIDNALQGVYGLRPYDIILTTPFAIPRTTSGKLQRLQCREHYRRQEFTSLGAKLELQEEAFVQLHTDRLIAATIACPDHDTIKKYLIALIGSKLEHVSADWTNDAQELTALGIDSIKTMELINIINRDLNINVDAAKLFQDNTFGGLVMMLENMLWLKNTQPSGKEITI